ncbi:hypothetical protein, partial [Rhodoplanes serenus]|uniref:hypothetical protein n=1 Tax=Rhodoplanes serenus TaxID=200615 RepID=UPI001AECCC6F
MRFGAFGFGRYLTDLSFEPRRHFPEHCRRVATKGRRMIRSAVMSLAFAAALALPPAAAATAASPPA